MRTTKYMIKLIKPTKANTIPVPQLIFMLSNFLVVTPGAHELHGGRFNEFFPTVDPDLQDIFVLFQGGGVDLHKEGAAQLIFGRHRESAAGHRIDLPWM